MVAKINVAEIIKDHIFTLKNNDSGKFKIGDFILFYLFPAAIGLFLFNLQISLQKDTVNLLVTALSVFAALLFNLLILIYDIVNKDNDKNRLDSLKKRFLKEIYTNISYSIFIAILSIIVLVLYLLNYDVIKGFPYTKEIKNIFIGLATFLMINFVMTLLMILKRVHILLSKEMKS